MIEALERMELPPMPTKVGALIDTGPPYLADLLSALADDMEHPGKGTARLAALPPCHPAARIIEKARRDNPMLRFTGLLQMSKTLRRLRQKSALMKRDTGHRVH